MQYVIYARKSSEDKKKQIQSIPDQLEWAYDIARERGMEVTREFIDTKTATKPGREGFNAMIQYVFAQKIPVGIITWKTDRLSRNPIDEGTIKYAFMKNNITHILSRDREFREGENQIIMGVEFGAATQYSIELSRNVKRGLKSKLQKGWQPCKAPQGYLNDVNGLKGEKKIFIDPERFSQIKKMWHLFLSGAYTIAQIREKANEEWGYRTPKGRKIGKSQIYKIFSNSFYSGYIHWNGELHKGNHPPMITWAEYEQVQVLLHRKDRPRPIRHERIYSGIMKCGECGYSIITEPTKRKVHPKTGKARLYDYLRCSKRSTQMECTQKCIRKELLENQIEKILASVEIPDAFHQWAMQELKETKPNEMEEMSRVQKNLSKELENTTRMLSTLDEKLLNSVISDETYKANKTRITVERAKLESQIHGITSNADLVNTLSLQCIDFAKSLSLTFENGNGEVRRRILHSIGSNYIVQNRSLTAELKFPFQYLKNISKGVSSSFSPFEPTKKGSLSTKSEPQNSVISRWSRILHQVRTYFLEEYNKNKLQNFTIPQTKEEIFGEI